MAVTINMLGEMELRHNSTIIPMPASKRSRALLAYLAFTARPHRRDTLCEVFWDVPDDPKGALRWSLSKIRPLVNNNNTERLIADRERVVINCADINIDLKLLIAKSNLSDLSCTELEILLQQSQQPFLQGLDLPNQKLFQDWLMTERNELRQLSGQLLVRLASHVDLTTQAKLLWAQAWLTHEPLSTRAANTVLSLLQQLEQYAQATLLSQQLLTRFNDAGIVWAVELEQRQTTINLQCNELLSGRELLARQKVQFCTSQDSVRIAYASLGKGPTIVKAANWLSHLEHDWNAPIWSPLFKDLAADHHFVRYDERGNGLSDWDVEDISFNTFVTDLETVVAANKLDTFSLLGISQGAAVSIEYAIRHPEKVSHLILFGGYAAGWRIGATEAITKEREAVMMLTHVGWGTDNPAYRQIFSSTFMPDANEAEFSWFNDFQRLTTSTENAVRFLSVFADIDVRHRLAQVKVPTLVIHSLGDQRIPVSVGREIAATIPNAEFVGLESNGHLLLGREPASKVFVEAIREFIARHQ
ncbi:alpha/beta fold hydrolase [Shewanella profunda]|uniref:alpha/beta hydrolase n=1 Tax=Shewanella profunda TaxID=254793 RepID=UPI00200EB106|nr:alpha/beta hydrolase [Shewanella profunda]MCL1091092.1 alpha/beta fold hydrolase [Shewanella profunda]